MSKSSPHARGFTLVELLIVIGIVALLIGILLPALNQARQMSRRTKCLSNLRSMAIAQAMYAAENKNLLVVAGDGSYAPQGSWIGLLEPYAGKPLVRVCPDDRSPFFENPDTTTGASVYRTTSYAINNYVSPTHSPSPDPVRRITQVRRSSSVVQFVELGETGSYAVGDHVHAQLFYSAAVPHLTLNKISSQMPVGRHGGMRRAWSGVLNYAFLDGHAEALALADVYTDPTKNRFNPDVAP